MVTIARRPRVAGLATIAFAAAWILAASIARGAEPQTWLLRIGTTDEGTLARLADAGARPVRVGPTYTLVLATPEEESASALAALHPVRLGPWHPSSAYYIVAAGRDMSALAPLADLGLVLLREAGSAVVEVPPGREGLLSEAFEKMRVFDRPLRCGEGLRRGREESSRPRTLVHDPQIQAMVDGVDQAWLQARAQDLQDFGTRRSDSQGGVNAQTYLVSQFTSIGYTDVTTYSYNTWCDDVIAVKPGAATPDQIYVIGGHYDSTSSTSSAPGADDNASGAVAVLAAARALFPYQFESTVYFCCWSGEEQGLVGSDAWCSWAVGQGLDIRGYINLDMEGYLNSTENLDLVSNGASSWMHDLVFEAVPLYVPTLPVVNGSLPFGASSDHASFWDHGYSAVMFFEDSNNYSPYIHTPQDVIGTSLNNFPFMKKNTQAALACLAVMASPFSIAIDHTPLPDTPDVSQPYPVTARILAAAPLVGDSLRLRYRVDGGPFTWVHLLPSGLPDEYGAEIPAQHVGATVDYYLRARDVDGNTRTAPPGAPESLYSFSIPSLIEDFEAGGGWVVNLEQTDTATTGQWIQADPIGTTYNGNVIQPEDDHTADPGTVCWVTGNGSPGGAAGEADVDNGATTLYSAVYDLSGMSAARVKYWRWYTDDLGVNAGDDTWITQVRNNEGPWQDLEHTTNDCNCWVQPSFDLLAMFGQDLGLVQFKFIADDEGANSLLEALVDDFELVAATSAGVPESASDRARFALYAAQPNPARGGAEIRFRIPATARVELGVYDAAGRTVRTLASGGYEAGSHALRWDGLDPRGHPVPSGVYYVRMDSNGFHEARTLVLVR